MLLGWWAVAVIGVAAGLTAPAGRRTALEAAAGAVLGWAAILAASAVGAPVWAVAQQVGPLFRVPALGFVAVTLVFPALVAGSAALLTCELRLPARAAQTR
jgi:hypothetical protein